MRQKTMEKPAKQGTVPERHKELFHYTTISALKGILDTNSLWATKTTHLNDQSETELIWPSMEQQVIEQYQSEILGFIERNPEAIVVIDRMGGVSQVANADGSRIVGEMHLKLVGDDDTPSIAPKFIVSFATHSNDSPRDEYHRANGMLSQWRAYCGDEPVAIIFDAVGIDRLLRAENQRYFYWPLLIGDTVYLEKDLSLKNRFPSLFSSLRACARNFIEPRDRESLEDLMPKAYQEASDVCALLKHFGFHEEKECRIVVGGNDGTPSRHACCGWNREFETRQGSSSPLRALGAHSLCGVVRGLGPRPANQTDHCRALPKSRRVLQGGTGIGELSRGPSAEIGNSVCRFRIGRRKTFPLKRRIDG